MNKNPSPLKVGSRRLLALLLALCFSFGHISAVSAKTIKSVNKQTAEELGYEPAQRKLVKGKRDTYVRISRAEFEEIERQAFIARSILHRIRDLEKLYKQIKEIVETAKATIDFIKTVLNIDDKDIDDEPDPDDSEFEHISGVTMAPGYVEIQVSTADPSQNFEDVITSNFLEFDLYYNKRLFTIDHIEGKSVFGEEFKTIALPQKTSAAKDRIKLPLSDVLSNEASFKVYLGPLDHNEIEIGDSTKLDVRYYKRVPMNADGERIPPLNYRFSESSADEITVIDKRG
ncbi:MAG: hypothetical protein OXU45_08810 [Candidatus Melainabacteria bacterium]|nr:hypothetical protein [Candidatus Melainabacteria bacterium]